MKQKKITIPDWTSYFMQLAQVVKTRGNCVLIQVGSVLVKDYRIIATGYNGTPRGVANCLDGGCSRCMRKKQGVIGSGDEKGFCLCVHAEVNTILQSAYHGVSTRGADMYTTLSPCMLCSKEIINAGIRSLYYQQEDRAESASVQLLRSYLERVEVCSPL